MVGQDMCGVDRGYLLQHRKPARRCAAAKVNRRFLVENHVGRTQYNTREQLFILRRALAEHIDHLLPVLLHFLLLHGVADQDGTGRKAGLTSSVLRLEMGGGEEELRVVGREFCGHACGGSSILRAQARIDDESRVATDDYGDIGKPIIAQTWSEIFVVFSLTIGWLICANALVAVSATSVRSVESDFIVSLLHCAEVRPHQGIRV